MLGGPRHAGGPLFCAPKIAPNCPESAPKTCSGQPSNATSRHSKKPLKPLRFKGFRLVDDTGLEPVTSRTSSIDEKPLYLLIFTIFSSPEFLFCPELCPESAEATASIRLSGLLFITWLYTFKVIRISSWPARYWTFFTSKPPSIKRVI